MDSPPEDFGSDRYDYIEIQAPEGMDPPDQLLLDSLESCGDCRANVFIQWDATAGAWHRTIAHDDGCPTMAAIEKSPPS